MDDVRWSLDWHYGTADVTGRLNWATLRWSGWCSTLTERFVCGGLISGGRYESQTLDDIETSEFMRRNLFMWVGSKRSRWITTAMVMSIVHFQRLTPSIGVGDSDGLGRIEDWISKYGVGASITQPPASFLPQPRSNHAGSQALIVHLTVTRAQMCVWSLVPIANPCALLSILPRWV